MNTGKVNHRRDSCYRKYNCKCIPKYQSNQHIQILIDTFQDFSGYQTYDQCKCTNYQMIPWTEVFHSASTTPGIHTYRQKWQSNRDNYTSRYNRSQIFSPVLGTQSDKTFKNTTQNNCTNHTFISKIRIRCNYQQTSKERKADSHNNRKSGSDHSNRI